jgi:hypothetical protein
MAAEDRINPFQAGIPRQACRHGQGRQASSREWPLWGEAGAATAGSRRQRATLIADRIVQPLLFAHQIRAGIFFVLARRQRIPDAHAAAQAGAARLKHDQHEAAERRDHQREAPGELVDRKVIESTHFLLATETGENLKSEYDQDQIEKKVGDEAKDTRDKIDALNLEREEEQDNSLAARWQAARDRTSNPYLQ